MTLIKLKLTSQFEVQLATSVQGKVLHDTVYHVITFYTNLNIIIYN